MATILAVDNEDRMCQIIKSSLELESHIVDMAFSGQQAIDMLQQKRYDVVVSDLKMKPLDGMQVLEYVRAYQPDCEVILITAFASQETALKAMKMGANDYLIKPFKMDELELRIERIMRQKSLERENKRLKQPGQDAEQFPGIIGKSGAMRAVFEKIRHVCQTDTAVQLRGESGTGKDLLARAIHNCSGRSKGPFVTINCAALPENLLESELFGFEKGAFSGAHKQKQGLFETANSGTIFLDEIGDLPLSLQAKLLHVLQNNEIVHLGGTEPIPVDFRLVTATHRDLEEMIQAQQFRSDLYYRINVFPIQVPPLRDRKEDIPELVAHFLRDYPEKSLSAAARLKLMEYDYPGNIRELQNIIARSLIGPDEIISDIDLPARSFENSANQLQISAAIPDEGIVLDEVEQQLIRAALEKAAGNKSQAAQLLGITRRRLYSLMERFHMRS